MEHEHLLEQRWGYAERYPRERHSVSAFFSLLEEWPHCLSRDHMPGHLTGSAWVVNPNAGTVLLLHHRKLDRWLQPGGHADGNPDIAAVALKELQEETGLSVDTAEGAVFDLDIHDIPAYGETPEHQHFDLRFLVLLPNPAVLAGNEESNDLRWVSLEKVATFNGEESIRRMVAKTETFLHPR